MLPPLRVVKCKLLGTKGKRICMLLLLPIMWHSGIICYRCSRVDIWALLSFKSLNSEDSFWFVSDKLDIWLFIILFFVFKRVKSRESRDMYKKSSATSSIIIKECFNFKEMEREKNKIIKGKWHLFSFTHFVNGENLLFKKNYWLCCCWFFLENLNWNCDETFMVK